MLAVVVMTSGYDYECLFENLSKNPILMEKVTLLEVRYFHPLSWKGQKTSIKVPGIFPGCYFCEVNTRINNIYAGTLFYIEYIKFIVMSSVTVVRSYLCGSCK